MPQGVGIVLILGGAWNPVAHMGVAEVSAYRSGGIEDDLLAAIFRRRLAVLKPLNLQ